MTETKREIPILYLVVPCYNEEEVVEKTASVMDEKLTRLEREKKLRQVLKLCLSMMAVRIKPCSSFMESRRRTGGFPW